jgi:predicted transcriptional regulator
MNGGRKGVSAIDEAVTSDQVGDQVSDQVIRLLDVLGSGEIGAADLMGKLNLSHRPTFRKNYLEPALTAGVIERTQPESPRSPTQRYRLTKKGKAFISKRQGNSIR